MRLLVCVMALLFACLAQAHERSESTSHWTLVNGDLHGIVTARTREVTRLTVPGDTYASLAQIFAAHVQHSVEASVDGVACKQRQMPSLLESEPGYVRVDVRMQCPSGNVLALKVNVLFGVAPSHHHFLYVAAGGSSREAILSASEPSTEVALRTSGNRTNNFAQFMGMGIEHIATGIDHLAFLLALLITARRARQVLAIVTGFTVGHSITLSLAVLGVIQANRGAVECLIGLTIAMAAAQNLIRGEREGRIAGLAAAAIATSLLLIPADLRPDMPASLVIAIALATGSAVWLASMPRQGVSVDYARASHASNAMRTAEPRDPAGNAMRAAEPRGPAGDATRAAEPRGPAGDATRAADAGGPAGDVTHAADAIGREISASHCNAYTRTGSALDLPNADGRAEHAGNASSRASAAAVFSIPARFAMAAGFGLIHGLGFASALQDLHLPRAMLLSSLLGFNVGVEIGQLAVVIAAVGLIAAASKLVPLTQRRTEMSAAVASAALLAAGIAWFLIRAY